jgi:hypothetical protein
MGNFARWTSSRTAWNRFITWLQTGSENRWKALDGGAAERRTTITSGAGRQMHTTLGVIRLPDPIQPDQLSTAVIRQFRRTHTASAMNKLAKGFGPRLCQPQSK